MKTTDSRNPLDRKIDDLLASRPLQPSSDFTQRVLAAADDLPAPKARPSHISKLVHFALPAAAAIAAACLLVQFIATTPAVDHPSTLSAADIQEIFLLEEGLSGFTQLQDDHLSSDALLNTLEALKFDIKS
ncbi:MAG TPA: hypothetical protein DD423_05510 [Opitutae bacterium]|jgi:hypothetical protein|nr:hypothetical protein [Opitutae bacterium]